MCSQCVVKSANRFFKGKIEEICDERNVLEDVSGYVTEVDVLYPTLIR